MTIVWLTLHRCRSVDHHVNGIHCTLGDVVVQNHQRLLLLTVCVDLLLVVHRRQQNNGLLCLRGVRDGNGHESISVFRLCGIGINGIRLTDLPNMEIIVECMFLCNV